MSYIVERKVNGNIYRYEIESYWDKDTCTAYEVRIKNSLVKDANI